MPVDNDTFGPWTPPGSGGRPEDEDSTPSGGEEPTGEPTTQAIIVEELPFWSSTIGVLDTGRRTAWERCQLGEHSLPGIVQVKVTPAKRKVDVKSPDGKAQAKQTVKGWDPAKVEVALLLWTPTHLREWQEVRLYLRDPNDDKESDPLEIVNPVTELENIHSVLVTEIGGLEDARGIPGAKTVKISANDWTAEAKDVETTTPTGAKSAETDTTDSKARADAEAAWLALVGSGADVPWEDIAKAHGLEPPGPPPPIPPGIDDDWDTPGYWEEDERTYE